jgi:hypothetical protein
MYSTPNSPANPFTRERGSLAKYLLLNLAFTLSTSDLVIVIEQDWTNWFKNGPT